MTAKADTTGDLLRRLAPQVLGALVRQYGQFDACEDAVQEALLAAIAQWPTHGTPAHPRAWLATVARRCLIDFWRSDSARRRRETAVAALEPPAADQPPDDRDDTLVLLFLCCHPALSPTSQIALTLRAVGGLTTVEIAAAFLVPTTTMAKRISRAKRTISAAGARFEIPPPGQRPERLHLVSQVLYLIFNEGYTAHSGKDLHRADLSSEAIRLTRLLHRLVPADAEVAGLLALMLLTDARRGARTDANGSLVPLDEQDRRRWDPTAIHEGVALLHDTLGTATPGPFQVQAAIAALHDEAETATATDWPQILALYEVLTVMTPGPLVALSRAVALSRVYGPAAALATLDDLDADERMAHSHRLDAVRAHLLEQVGDLGEARQAYRRAARDTASLPERRYLATRAARLDATEVPGKRRRSSSP